jgi:1-acyl-sn-glycerol-3-phosphate acyltransferase
MTIRALARICLFAFEITLVILNYFFTAAFVASSKKRAARAVWLHRSSVPVLKKIFNCTATVTGPVPRTGLLVSNHLSYLDIILISAITPSVFVSKAEVRNWPLFGWLASRAGTV